jgi:tetratricopeptide (TPR) repeat protein
MSLYDAFVSYSHAKDKRIAAALQSVVQKLGKPWYRRRALRVFRDDTSLSATPHLWPTIEQALAQSRFLILLASPEAAASQWVDKEVAYWLEKKSADTLLIAVTSGALSWDDAANDFVRHDDTPLPPALKGCFAAEPKWVDLTAYRDGADKGDAKFTELAADFAAAVRGMPKEDLLSQEVKQQRRALRLAFSAAALLLVLAVGATTAGILAYRAQQEAVAQRNRAEQTLAAATETANGLVFDLAQRFRDAVGVPAALINDILDRAIALQKQLTASGQTTPELRRSEAAALEESVDTLLAIGDTAGALTAAEGARQIFEALLTNNSANTGSQSDLSLSYEKVGNVLVAAGQREEALAAYQKSLAIRQQLADSDKDNAEWQGDLSIAYNKIADVQAAQGQVTGSLASYRSALAILAALIERDKDNEDWRQDLAYSVQGIGASAYRLLLGREFVAALEAADEAIAVTPDQIWLYTNRAHALMFLGRTEEARALYLRYRGEKNVDGQNTWEAVVLDDFAELRKAGLASPLMDEIEKQFTTGG